MPFVNSGLTQSSEAHHPGRELPRGFEESSAIVPLVIPRGFDLTVGTPRFLNYLHVEVRGKVELRFGS